LVRIEGVRGDVDTVNGLQRRNVLDDVRRGIISRPGADNSRVVGFTFPPLTVKARDRLEFALNECAVCGGETSGSVAKMVW